MRNKHRVVIDTNVIISALLKEKSIPRQAIEFTFRHHIFLASSETFIEVRQKLILPKFDIYISSFDRQDFLERLFSLATFVDTTSNITDCRDRKDNRFLKLAVDGKADYIVSGDKDLLVLNPYRGISIINSKDFLSRER